MKQPVLTNVFIFISVVAYSQSSTAWSTYFGGSGYDFSGQTIATDASGNVFVTGNTDSPTGIAFGGFQNALAGNTDAFLAKFDAAGNRIWATYYGGNAMDRGTGVALDALGNIYMTGQTESTSGIASGGFQNSYTGGDDCFLVKFDPSGNRIWATYFGGTTFDRGWSVATDLAGNSYVTGETSSFSGIAFNGFQNSLGGNTDGFLVKFDPSGNRLWSTYYGAVGNDYGLSVYTDVPGNIYVAGITTSSTAIASGGFQNIFGGNGDAFLVKFDPSGNRIWGTYYGGTGYETGYSVIVDDFGDVYLAGQCSSASNISSGGFQNTYGGGNYDGFVAKFDPSGTRKWATYYGGTGTDYFYSVAADSLGNVYATGNTDSPSNIAYNGFQPSFAGGVEDAFIVSFDSSGNRYCSSYFGGPDIEEGWSVAVGPGGTVYFAGETYSTSGIASGGFQNTIGGNKDAFLLRFPTCAFSGAGIGDDPGLPSLDIYPNPSSGTFRIDAEITDGYVEIYDALGEKVLEKKITGKTTGLDLGCRTKGIYCVKIWNDKGMMVSKKMVIE